MTTAEIDRCVEFIKRCVGDRPIVIGVSGGVDSAVCLNLCARAVGPNKIIAMHLPTGITPEIDTRDVYEECRRIGVVPTTKQISGLTAAFIGKVGRPVDKQVIGNLSARVRMVLLYALANKHNGRVCGTGNRTEYFLGYTTKYGDNAADFYPILHLLKTEVWAMAQELEVVDSIIAKPPSAGLWEGQTDESEIGMSYYAIDAEITAYLNLEKPIRPVLSKIQKANLHKSEPGPSLLQSRW